MTFRFTLEHFIGVLNIELKLAGVVSNRTWERNLAFQIAKHANALLEAEEAKCEPLFGNIRAGVWIQGKHGNIPEEQSALLWNVERIDTEIAGIKIVADPKLKDGEAHLKYCDKKWGSE